MIGFPAPTSPYTFYALDGIGHTFSISFPYDDATTGGGTGAINGPVTVHRDAGCLYRRVAVDVGGDGTPDTSGKVFNMTGLTGDRTFTVTQVNHVGLVTIDDVKTTQITCMM